MKKFFLKIWGWIKSNLNWNNNKNCGLISNAILSVALLLGVGLTQAGAAIAGMLIICGIKWGMYLIKSNRGLENDPIEANIQFTIGAALWFAYMLLI